MRPRRALVVHTRMPAFDRDSGSQDIDNTVQFLLEAGWEVTFLAKEEQGLAEERHANRLRQLGVATYAGLDWTERITRSSRFDLAIIAFWELAEIVIPILREQSPATRVIVNSMDVHFLRLARRSFGRQEDLETTFGAETSRELGTYNDADAVIAVSEKERALLGDFLGDDRVFTLPLAESIKPSPFPLDERRGMFFVGNFRHVPNREAAEFLCNDVVPLLDPGLLESHPVMVIGNWLDKVDLSIDRDTPGIELIGWVPSVEPYLQRSRLALVPLLHGAGVKRKVIQAMMASTPVVTTPIGAESLDIRQGEHALIAEDAADMAAGITRLLSEDDLWHRLATAGATHVEARHSVDLVRSKFRDIVEKVMQLPGASDRSRRAPVDGGAHDRGVVELRRRIQAVASPGEVVLVASGGDEDLVTVGSQPCWHFPQGRDGGPAGYDPADGPAAITHLEAQRVAGARWFVLPRRAFSWRHRYRELWEHLERYYPRRHQDEHLMLFDLGEDRARRVALEETPDASVHVLGTYSASRTGPPPALLNELASIERLRVTQEWRSDAEVPFPTLPDTSEADYVVLVRDDTIAPSGFLDDLIATQATLEVDRLQPAHTSGPDLGPPATERQRGVVAREVGGLTPLPVVSVRRGAGLDGPCTISDDVTIGLRSPLPDERCFDPSSTRLWVADDDGRLVEHLRAEPDPRPRISVLIATYDRAELLRECLECFARQTLHRADYEVVVVDDGSHESTLPKLVDEFDDVMQIHGRRPRPDRTNRETTCVRVVPTIGPSVPPRGRRRRGHARTCGPTSVGRSPRRA